MCTENAGHYNRNVYIDNAKGFLIFLVVLGHVIEKYIYDTYWFIPYAYIYIFHMPLFIFFSGYFSRNAEEAQRKAFSRFLLPYFILNSLYYILRTILEKRLIFSFLHDGWMLWYFLSLFNMCIMLPAIMRLKCNIFLVFCLSLIIGFFSEFGSFLSLSRTICFGGYFLLGCYCKENVFGKIKESKKMVFCVTVIISILLFVFFTSKYGISHARDIIITLRRSSAYKNMEIDRINGFLFRVITIPLSILFSIFILAFIPNTKTIFTGLGKRSVIIFVFHGYFIRLIEKTININSDSLGGIMLLILFSIGITFFLSIPLFHKIYDKTIKRIESIIVKQ